jgi:hypothetical protein
VVANDEDRSELERLIVITLERCCARVHAYCWLEREIHLAVQIADIPLGRVIQSFAGPYAQRTQRKRGQRGHLFAGSYRALLVDPREYLSSLVRHIHRAPIRAGLVKEADQYSWSGHRAYLGLTVVPWLTTETTLNHFARRQKGRARELYRRYVELDVANEEIARFEDSRPPHIVGDQAFVNSALGRRPPRRAFNSLEQVVDSVARTLGVTREDVVSPSRQRKLSLARAVITWHATRSGVATLAEVARYLQRDPSTLSVGVERYRRLRSTLFTLPKAYRTNR